MSHLAEQRTWVYRCYCEHRALMYVGIAVDVERRLKQHAASSEWWPQVDSIQSDQFRDRQQALAVERLWIREYRPRHNKTGKPPYLLPTLHPLRRHDFDVCDGLLETVLCDIQDLRHLELVP